MASGKHSGSRTFLLILLSVIIVLFSQLILPTPQDIHTFYNWMTMGFERGVFYIYQWSPSEVFLRFRDFSVNYPPLILILYPMAWCLHELDLWPQWPSLSANLFFRIPLILGHYFICLKIFETWVDRSKKNQLLLWLVLILLNPAFLIAGPVWGQLNFLLWGFVTLSLIYWSQQKLMPSAFYAMLGAITKPQFIMFLPILCLVLATSRDWKRIFNWVICFLGTLLVAVSPWLFTSGFDWLRSGYTRVSQSQYAIADIGYGLWWMLSRTFNINIGLIQIASVGARELAIVIPNLIIGIVGLKLFLKKSFFSWDTFSAFSMLVLFSLLPGMNALCLIFGTAFVCLSCLKRPTLFPIAVSLSFIQIYQLAYNAIWTPNTRLYLGLQIEIAKILGAICFFCIIFIALFFYLLTVTEKEA